jgi:hypothetical protein
MDELGVGMAIMFLQGVGSLQFAVKIRRPTRAQRKHTSKYEQCSARASKFFASALSRRSLLSRAFSPHD